MKFFLAAVAMSLLVWSGQAMAAKNGTIQGTNVVLRADPGQNSPSISTLKNGDPVEVSNYPTNGFYKIRTASGQVGWVESSAIGEESLPSPSDAAAAPAAPTAPVTETPATPAPPAEETPTATAAPVTETPAMPAVPPETSANPAAPPETPAMPPTPPETPAAAATATPPETPAAVAAATSPETPPAATAAALPVTSPPAAAAAPLPPPSTMGSPTAPKVEIDPDLIPFEDAKNTADNRIIEKALEPQKKTKMPRQPFQLKVFGGLQSLESPLTFSQLGGNAFSSMTYFGLQFGIPIDERLLLLFRIEELSSSATINGFNMSLSSTPLMTGLSYSLLEKNGPVQLQAVILIGVALSTTLDATQTSLPPPNLSELSTQAFTEMLKLDLDIPVSKSVELYFEGGYRFLNSSSVGPSTQASGNTIFQSQSGAVVPIPINLTGFLIGGGIGFLL